MPIPDPFAGRSDVYTQPDTWKLVTPSDVTDLPSLPKALWADVAGTIKMTGSDGNPETFTVAAGLVNLRPTRVWSTGTTATGIKALY